MTKTPKLQYTVLTVLLLWAFTAQLTYSAYIIYVNATATKNLGVPILMDELSRRILGFWSGFDGAGLKVNDKVLAFNGKPYRGLEQFVQLRFSLHPGDLLTATVYRKTGGHSSILTFPIRMHAFPPPSYLQWAGTIGLTVVFPLISLLVGFYIAFARPRDPLAWITMAMLIAFSQFAGSGYSWAIWPPWRELRIAYHSILNENWPVLMVLFALYFPVPFDWIKRHSWVNWIIALPCLALTAIDTYGSFMGGNHIDKLGWLSSFDGVTRGPLYILFSLYIGAFFALLGTKQGIVKAPDAQRRLRIMMYGCWLALGPIIPIVLAQFNFIPQLPFWLETICLFMLLFFPLTMGYVIVVQRAMDVRMAVRTGVRYALASTGVRVLQFALISATVAATARLAVGRETWQAIDIAAIGVVLVTGFRRISTRVSNWMDRRFFREAYNAEAVLTELSNSVISIRDVKTLLETVSQRISAALHVERIAILLNRRGLYEPAYAVGFNGTQPEVALRRETATLRLLLADRSPSRVYFDDPQSWVHGTSEYEQNALQALNSQILLPMTLNNRMLGVISLGPKKSELPYSRGDLQLLSAVAGQTGLALENAELTESIRREVAQRERVDRELEIAREVQQRLFPQKLPCVKGLDFAGYCRPAFGVGGDYYDFVRLPDDSLGIAIGDVSGKGIAAALMMASLQASLRGQAIKPSPTLSEMVNNINRLVYEASADNRYATFFYAQYNPANRVLRYVNAGHNPPIICRFDANGQRILRLDEGGTVVGLFPDFPYHEAQIALQPSDIFVAFTDGISEAMNNAEEEFDETRLIDAIRQCESRSAAEMISSILDRVDGFTEGAPQHDDMTLVVMRVQ